MKSTLYFASSTATMWTNTLIVSSFLVTIMCLQYFAQCQSVVHINCSKTPAEIDLADSYYEIRAVDASPECAFSLESKSGHIFEIVNPTVAKNQDRLHETDFSCPDSERSYILEPYIVDKSDNGSNTCPQVGSPKCESGNCPAANCPLLRIGDDNGFLSMAPLYKYEQTNPPMLISNSNQVFVKFCHGWETGKSLVLRIRTVPKNGQYVKANSEKQTFSSPMFPNGYIQSGQTYRYSLSNVDVETGESFTNVLITFDDLDLDEGDTIEVGPEVILKGQVRKSVYLEFDDVTTHYDVIVRTVNKKGRWSQNIGWRFTVEFKNEIAEYDYYGFPVESEVSLNEIETVTKIFELSQTIKSHRFDIKVDKLLDHLLIFKNLPPKLRLSVFVPVIHVPAFYSQEEDDQVLMQIRDGDHSDSTLIANFTSSAQLEKAQPRHGFIISSAYIRVRCHVKHRSLITIIVTPFLPVQKPKLEDRDQCCNFPASESNRGGFLCRNTMRCIPAESACDSVHNCGESSISDDEKDEACRGARFEAHGMTARNMCRTDAKAELCPWGTWVRHQNECSLRGTPHNAMTVVILGCVIGILIAVLVIISIFFKTRLIRQKQAAARNRRIAHRRGLDQRDSRYSESNVLPRSLAGSIENLDGTRSDLRLQMGDAPPSYEDLRPVGKEPIMYRDNSLFPYFIQDEEAVDSAARVRSPDYDKRIAYLAETRPCRPRLNAQDSLLLNEELRSQPNDVTNDVTTSNDDVAASDITILSSG